MANLPETVDFVIVGAGSAGCVMAARLSEDGRHSVAVLEAGGSDRSVFIQMPSALSIPMNSPRYDWGYESEPEPHLNGRRLHVPRGKVLGGSSSINGMVYIRGNALDFEAWEALGAAGWGYRNVLPYFRRAETREEGGDAWRGSEGPLHTSYGKLANPLYRAFIDAAVQAGYAETEDVNGYRQEGFGRMDQTIHRGRRWSAANAYLKPAMRRPNVTVVTSAQATSLMFEAGRAVGVAYRRGGPAGEERIVRARREVIVAAGPIASPLLLMRSGIGPAAHLASFSVPVLRDRPGVGGNLQDHLEFYFQVESREPVTLYSAMKPWSKALIGLRWLLRGDGLGATNHFESCGFIRSRAGVEWPDLQYHFLPAAIDYNGRARVEGHGFQAHVGPMRSKSRGEVRLASADPFAPPSIRFNYMSHEDDWTEMRAAVRLTREIFAQPAFERYRGRELQPGPDVRSDAEIDAFIRARVESAYHPCGTCRIGRPDDPLAVVDPELRVIGVDGLRVADTSVMPVITTGNLNAPAIMIGEKASDHVLGRPLLPASNAEFYVAPDWRMRQR
ncbi:choline dehydrogenase [Alsobacter sp. SYSU M60028]|uniref:Choline dehydrogenase n=1 Tax=Alsobacter ponti TaxID=2962936 RepID=A0ABT1LFC3_9HYPH|nr:choline dehydrogenase [Alsobacter ponti]MCP8940202.1 choline dehydrogenase [Alsobacter ponti]